MGPLSPARRRHVIGIVTLLSVVVMWLSSSFLMNAIFGELRYEKPFLVTYLCTSSFAGYLLPYAIGQYLRRRRGRRHENYESVPHLAEGLHDYDELSLNTQSDVEDDPRKHVREPLGVTSFPVSFTADSNVVTSTIPVDVNASALPPLTIRETAVEAMRFCFLWFVANYFSNAALQYTNVPSFTIISAMSGFFTLFIGVSVGVEKFTWFKLGALIMSITGVSIVSLQDSETSESETAEKGNLVLLGDAIALLGAAFYGCYTTLLKLRIQHESRVDMTLFFGFVGLYCLIFLWPFIIILSVLGIEPLEAPPSTAATLCILANMAITFVSDYLWILAMLMTSPLIVTMGLSLSIPLALLGDFVFKGQLKGLFYWCGAGMVLTGFSIVNFRRDEAHSPAERGDDEDE